MYDREDTLATHPSSIFILDLAIIERSSLVHFDTSAMYSSSERDLIRMKVFPT